MAQIDEIYIYTSSNPNSEVCTDDLDILGGIDPRTSREGGCRLSLRRSITDDIGNTLPKYVT